MKRKRVIISALFLLLFVFSIYHSLNLLQINENVKKAVLVRAAPYISGEIFIDHVALGISSLHIKGLEMKDRAGRKKVVIRDIIITLDLLRLIKTGFDFEKSVKRIEFNRPRLYITPGTREKVTTSNQDEKPLNSSPGKPGTGFDLSRFPIDRIIIKKGMVSFNDPQMNFLNISDINGAIVVTSEKNSFHLNGSILGTEKKTIIEGSTDMAFSQYDFRLVLEDAVVQQPVRIKKDIFINTAEISIRMNAWKKKDRPIESTIIEGAVILKKGSILLPGPITVTDLNGNLEMLGDSVKISTLTGKAFNRPISINGFVSPVFHPFLSVSIAIDNINLSHPEIRKLTGKLNPEGNVDLRFFLSGSLINPELKGEIASGKVQSGIISVLQPDIKFSIHNDSMNIDEAIAKTLGGNINAAGCIHFLNNKPSDILIHASDINLFEFNTAHSNNLKTNMKADLHIKIENGKTNFTINAAGGVLNNPYLEKTIMTAYSDEKDIQFKFLNESKTVSISGSIQNYYTEPECKVKINTKNIDISFLLGKSRKALSELIYIPTSDISLIINKKRLKCLAIFSAGGFLAQGNLYGTGQISNPFSNARGSIKLFSDTLTLFGTEGAFSCNIYKEPGLLSFRDMKFSKTINGGLDITDGSVKGSLAINAFPISQRFGELSGLEILKTMAPEGIINGSLSLHGTIDNPEIESELKLAKGRVGNLYPLSGHLSLSNIGKTICVKDMTIDLPGQRLLVSDNLRFGNGRLEGKFKLSGINIAQLFGDTVDVGGKLSLDFASTSNGRSDLLLAVDNLRYKKTNINYLKAGLTETNGLARITKFLMGNQNLSLEATGVFPLPFSTTGGERIDSLDLNVTFNGDLLKELAQSTEILKNKFAARTEGRALGTLHFTGHSNSIKLSSGYIDITKDKNAVLYPTMLVPGKISGFKAYIGINNSFASIDIKGVIQGGKFRITNENSYPKEQNFKIDMLGLDFGVLRIYTPSSGISFHIPGLIPDGEYGEFEFMDKNNNPGFYVCGPIKRPTLIGTVRVNNTRFTVPPVPTSDMSNFELSYLKWDVTVRAGNNVKYFYNEKLSSLFSNKKVVHNLNKGFTNFFEYPFTELTIDRASVMTFTTNTGASFPKFGGHITSSKGYVHYAGQDFSNDIDAGVEFDGHDDIPIIWGSASTILRSGNRTLSGDEVTLTLYVKDPKSGVEMKKGKLHEFRLVPSSNLAMDSENDDLDAYHEIIGKNIDKNPQETMTGLAKSEGKAMFEKVFLQRMVTNYIEKTVLGISRQTLNPLFGTDVTPDVFRIEIESDKIFNYIDMSIWSLSRLRKDFLENAEFVTGKYFFNGSLFLNYSSQMDFNPDPEGLNIEKLHHRLGFEVTPWRYLYFNMDYEIGGIPGAINGNLNPNDIRSNIRLRMPLKKLQDVFTKESRKEKPVQ